MILYVSPPFGNFCSTLTMVLKNKNLVPIIGTYTQFSKPGKYLNLIKSLRYDVNRQGWLNKMNMSNDGITVGLKNFVKDKNTILSIGFNNIEEIHIMSKIVPNDISLEINLHNLNITKHIDLFYLENFISNTRKHLSVKISPFINLNEIEILYNIGFRKFHCSNTINTADGDLSGKELLKLNIPLIKNIKYHFCDEIDIIGGGGIDNISSAMEYLKAGADELSISTVFLEPLKFYNLYQDLEKNHII